MTILEKAVSRMQQLPIDPQQQVLRFIEFLSFELGDRQAAKVEEVLSVQDKPVVSCYDLTQKWIGIVDELNKAFNKVKKAKSGRKPFDHVLMFKILILKTQYNLSDDFTSFDF